MALGSILMDLSISRMEAEVTEPQIGTIVVYDTVKAWDALFFLEMEETIPLLFVLPLAFRAPMVRYTDL